jgi:hypothetical protein
VNTLAQACRPGGIGRLGISRFLAALPFATGAFAATTTGVLSAELAKHSRVAITISLPDLLFIMRMAQSMDRAAWLILNECLFATWHFRRSDD